jgi:para-aminobenzoate synthetase component 1
MDSGPPLPFTTIPLATQLGAPLVVELVPAPDPWLAARKLAHLPHLLFLDSAAKHNERGRYSYVSANARWCFVRRVDPDSGFDSVFSVLRDQRLRPYLPKPTVSGLPPFQGGVAGLFGYALGRETERIPAPPYNEFRGWDCEIALYDWVLCWDHLCDRAWLISHSLPANPPYHSATNAEDTLADVLRWLRAVQLSPHTSSSRGWSRPSFDELCPQYALPRFPGVTSNFSREGYEDAVRRAVEYIRAGDCFQVNLAQRLLAPLHAEPLELYGRLRERNPAPFAAYLDLGDRQILSSSPERFLRLYPDREVESRPIKGTRRRGGTPEEDAALVLDLTTNAKERAENVMIVDLLRNDIGKVCLYGSVRVTRVCEVETFRFVHHLVSEVRGSLRPGLGPLDLLAAAFPGGSVTGAPKVRAMEIIAELEPTARGPYCGSVGWIGFDGAMDTNILIRTFTASRGWLQFPVGGGIVAESDPAREYDETLHKAAGMLRTLE